MTPSHQHQEIVVEDLTTSPDPREHRPSARADFDLKRVACTLSGSLIDFVGLNARDPKASPYDFTEAVLYLITTTLIAGTVAIPVAVMGSVLGGVIAGVATLIAGVVLIGLTRRH